MQQQQLHVIEMTSSYLLRPLRSLEQAMRDLKLRRAANEARHDAGSPGEPEGTADAEESSAEIRPTEAVVDSGEGSDDRK